MIVTQTNMERDTLTETRGANERPRDSDGEAGVDLEDKSSADPRVGFDTSSVGRKRFSIR